MLSKKRIVAVITIICLILLIATGVTFSRFYQSIKGKGSMKLATWAFNATTNDNRPLSQISLEGPDGEAIFPGSSGEFDININSLGSDIGIKYHTEVNNENLPKSMKFHLKNNSVVKFENIKDLATSYINGELDANNPTATYTICWEWPLNGQDVIDDSSNNYSFDIEVIGEQK